MTNIEPSVNIFTKEVSGAEYGIVPDIKLSFAVAVNVLDGDELELAGMILTPEISGIMIDIEGDIMPEGFAHSTNFTLSEERSNPAMAGTTAKIIEVVQRVADKYFQLQEDYLTTLFEEAHQNVSYVKNDKNAPTTEIKKLQFIMSGKKNNHLHWSGQVLN